MTEEILTEEKIDALYQQRLDKASEMREEGVNPYANDFRVDTRAVEFFNTYDAIESKEEVDAIETVHRMAGRVMAVNKFERRPSSEFKMAQLIPNEIMGSMPIAIRYMCGRTRSMRRAFRPSNV